MSFHAKIYRAGSGEFLAALRVSGRSLRDAEDNAVSKLALLLRANPRDLDVRKLHQVVAERRAA